MHDVLAALEAFHERAANIFDRVEKACGDVDDNLNALSDRLDNAVARVEASRGSTRALTVRNARVLPAPRSSQRTRRLFESNTLAALSSAAPLPEELGAGKFPTAKEAATALSTIVSCIKTPIPVDDAAQRLLPRNAQDKFLAPQDRLCSVSELFLFNSNEQIYKTARKELRYINNLAAPDEVEVQAASMLMPWQRMKSGQPNLQYDEDAQDPLMVDLRFAPKPVARVQFQLPETLDGLSGPVAENWTWREEDQLETETQRPEWDQAPTLSRSRRGTASNTALATPKSMRRDTNADLAAAARLLQSSADRPAPTSTKAAPFVPPPKREPAKPAPPVKTAPMAKPAASPPQAQEVPPKDASTSPGEVSAPPLPKDAKGKGKGKDKGKGKGKGKVVPAVPKNKGKGPAPPPKGGGPPEAGKAPPPNSALLGAIRGGTKLKKVVTKEKTGLEHLYGQVK